MTNPYRIELPTGLPIGSVNAYFFVEPEPILVDTGVKSEESLAALQAGLADHGLALADLSKVIISHPHIDHCGLAGHIAAHSQATVHIFESARNWLVDYRSMWARRIAFYRDDLFVYWQLEAEVRQPILEYYQRVEHAFDDVPANRVQTFVDGDTLTMGGLPWQVLYTPGHANTLTCYYQPETRQFLSTDMLLALTPTPIPELPLPGEKGRVPSLPQFLTSLQRVEKLDCEIIYPGHGDPFTDHHALIARQQSRIEARKQECLAFIKEGYDTLGQLLLQLYPHYPPEFRFAGLWMTMGYLDLLAAEGQIILAESRLNGQTIVEVVLP